MRRLADRLSRIPFRVDRTAAAEVEAAAAAIAALIERTAPTPDDRGDLSRLRPWWMAPTPYGACHVHRETQPAPPPVAMSDPPLARLVGDERLAGFDPRRALYLDIEATGLSHGAGTFAFLIGCAYFEGEHVVLEQLFVRDPTDEMPALHRFIELIERFPYLVSFNGKSYDLSVLQTRLVITRLLSRLETALKVRPHLDLLHVTRQAYRGAFEDGRLQTLERRVLQLDPAEREDDVPGSLVPALYFHFLRTGWAPHLDPVLRHNRTDVLSMVQLTRHLVQLFADPWDSNALVLYNLGRSALRRRLPARAARLLTAALQATCERSLPQEVRLKALLELLCARRRSGDLTGAAEAAREALHWIPASEQDERGRVERQAIRYERQAVRG